MNHSIGRYTLIFGLAVAVWVWNGDIRPTMHGDLLNTAEAVVGAPATPVSYAGVARRTTVRAVTPDVGDAAGVGYSGGVGVNLGGPVNRVGVG